MIEDFFPFPEPYVGFFPSNYYKNANERLYWNYQKYQIENYSIPYNTLEEGFKQDGIEIIL